MSDPTKQRVLFLSHDFSDNAITRTFALWLLAKDLGWETRVVGPQTRGFFAGLRGHEFEKDCFVAPHSALGHVRAVDEHARWATCIIACKPYPGSFGIGLTMQRRHDKPVILDLDDNELGFYSDLGWKGFGRVLGKRVRSGQLLRIPRDFVGMHNPAVTASLHKRSATVPKFVTGPVLQAEYGGTLMPSARPPMPNGAEHVSDRPVVAFMGTVMPHKGIEQLREAVARLAPEGFRLMISSQRPAEGAPEWEEWVGNMPWVEMLQVLSRADIVALPTWPSGVTAKYADFQVSIKLLDAMILGRAIVHTDLPSLNWATAGTAEVLPDPSVESLVTALRALKDPERRQKLGDATRREAENRFSVAALRDDFARVVNEAVAPVVTSAADVRTATAQQP